VREEELKAKRSQHTPPIYEINHYVDNCGGVLVRGYPPKTPIRADGKGKEPKHKMCREQKSGQDHQTTPNPHPPK
jgi:hypothetical protein